MLDERWSAGVEEVGEALRKLLEAECTRERVRKAEDAPDGRDPALETVLAEFGLDDLQAEPELFARIALELGRALAPTGHVDAMPVQALLGRPGVSLGFDGPVPAINPFVASRKDGSVFVGPLCGRPRRTAAGDVLVDHEAGAGDRVVGDAALADRLTRYRALTDAARIVGAGQALLVYGVDYAREREQFGRPIGVYQGIAHRLSRVAGDLDAAELLVRKAAFMAAPEQGGDGAPPRHFAIMVRAKAIAAGRSAATEVHQVFGGNGFAMEYDVQLFSRRIRSWTMRGPRAGGELAELGRMVLDPARRDAMKALWHHETGVPLPRWAREADVRGD